MAKTGKKQNVRAHKLYIEQLALADEMSAAMMSASLDYIASEGRFTPAMSDIWYRFVTFAIRANRG